MGGGGGGICKEAPATSSEAFPTIHFYRLIPNLLLTSLARTCPMRQRELRLHPRHQLGDTVPDHPDLQHHQHPREVVSGACGPQAETHTHHRRHAPRRGRVPGTGRQGAGE